VGGINCSWVASIARGWHQLLVGFGSGSVTLTRHSPPSELVLIK
jgi:hypothetical protein